MGKATGSNLGRATVNVRSLILLGVLLGASVALVVGAFVAVDASWVKYLCGFVWGCLFAEWARA